MLLADLQTPLCCLCYGDILCKLVQHRAMVQALAVFFASSRQQTLASVTGSCASLKLEPIDLGGIGGWMLCFVIHRTELCCLYLVHYGLYHGSHRMSFCNPCLVSNRELPQLLHFMPG